MSLGVLNNLNAIYATNNLNNTNNSLSGVLQQLSSGSRINSGADDAAGLSLVNGLSANASALTQSANNATQGVGILKVADGALSQVTNLLNRAVTLATEASNGTLNSSQLTAANQEYQSILAEINNIGTTTTYNQTQVFGQGSAATVSIYTGDSSSNGSSIDNLSFAELSSSSVGDAGGSVSLTAATASSAATITYTAAASNASVDLTSADISTTTGAQTTLNLLNQAIASVAAQQGYIGSQINTLNSVSQVISTQQQNIAAAQNAIQATDYATATSNLAKYEILSQTGISALAQANSLQQQVTKLLQ
ncbi:MAG TPA: flagellin [Terracidiphilus sp.]|nr:flagellin [Terracidiphilus sp.]